MLIYQNIWFFRKASNIILRNEYLSVLFINLWYSKLNKMLNCICFRLLNYLHFIWTAHMNNKTIMYHKRNGLQAWKENVIYFPFWQIWIMLYFRNKTISKHLLSVWNMSKLDISNSICIGKYYGNAHLKKKTKLNVRNFKHFLLIVRNVYYNRNI
jgi:hypothetical protein